MTTLPITRRERKMDGLWRARLLGDVVERDGCWIWQGRLDEHGYGRPTYGRELEQMAHRLSYRLFEGEIQSGYTLDHLCRTRSCVNPRHLEPVTLRENILRGEGVAAKRARQTHCKRGHVFSDENTYWFPNNRRGCRLCRADARRRRYLETGD